jgi:hypothetical protein
MFAGDLTDGGTHGPREAMFVPPHHSRVLAAIDDLLRFAQRDDIPALPQIALAHAQFGTIHPFTDGNGRTGRALIQAILRRKGLTRNVTVPVLAGLLTDTDSYFAALTAYREGTPPRSSAACRRRLWRRSSTVASWSVNSTPCAQSGTTRSPHAATPPCGRSPIFYCVRALPMPADLAAALRRERKRQNELQLRLGGLWPGTGHVVVDDLGNPPHPDNVTHAWADALAAAGLSRVRLYDAQHSCATLMHLNGIPETVIAAWLGHTDAGFTLSVYTHSNNGALADAPPSYSC